MSGKLIIDNWMLQDVNQALERGLSLQEVGEIVVDVEKDSHRFRMMPHAVFQIDALLTLLVNIVLRDSLIVDDQWMHVWDKGDESLQKLKDTHIVDPFDFASAEEVIAEIRRAIVNELCVTQSIRNVQREYGVLWDERSESFDAHTAEIAHMSALVWGGASYLALSHVHESPYLGCPYRQALIRQTKLVSWKRDAVKEVEYIISEKRTKLLQIRSVDRSANYAMFNLPPLAVEIIDEANDASQLIPIAMQLRDKYEKLREWLLEYQDALDSDDPQNILKHTKILESIARDIESKYSHATEDSVKITVGTSFLHVPIPVAKIVDRVKSKFGVRAMLTDLVFTGSGEKSLQKLLALFGEKNTQLAMVTSQSLRDRYSKRD
jgi:hypothetical protein